MKDYRELVNADVKKMSVRELDSHLTRCYDVLRYQNAVTDDVSVNMVLGALSDVHAVKMEYLNRGYGNVAVCRVKNFIVDFFKVPR